MFFYFRQPTAKILPFTPTAEPNYFVKNPLPKLSDAKKRPCQKCGEASDKLFFYEADYIRDPRQAIDYFDDAKWANTEVCRMCFCLLHPEDEF